MLKRAINFLKNEDGSEIVSLVFVMPIFVYIFAAIISFSQLCYAKMAALNAASTGARAAVLQGASGTALEKAQYVASQYISTVGMGVKMADTNVYASSWKRGEICTCVVNVNVSTAMPIGLGTSGIKGTYTLTGVCPMMIEAGE